MNFQDLDLHSNIQKALTDLKFEKATEIQEAVLKISDEGGDIMACAETGSGKTAAFSIPMLTMLLNNPDSRALILSPTRELATQIAKFVKELTKHCKGLHTTTLVGGMDIRRQFNSLKKNPRIIVATPGRLTDHLNRKSLHLRQTEMLILDEGDRMIDMGFAPQLEDILGFLPKQRQTLFFTATLPKKVQILAEKYLIKPKKINAGRVSLPVKAIKQSAALVRFKEKDDRIVDELNERTGSIIVFVRTKHRTDRLAQNLKDFGFKVDLIHGGRTQGQRNKAIRNFKEGKSRILCATDVAARGIDVPSVEHVINFDLPMMPEDYVHRIGRTARNGAKGEALSFVMPEERRNWQQLVRKYQITDVVLETGGKVLFDDADADEFKQKRHGGRGRREGGRSFGRSSGGDRGRGRGGRLADNRRNRDEQPNSRRSSSRRDDDSRGEARFSNDRGESFRRNDEDTDRRGKGNWGTSRDKSSKRSAERFSRFKAEEPRRNSSGRGRFGSDTNRDEDSRGGRGERSEGRRSRDDRNENRSGSSFKKNRSNGEGRWSRDGGSRSEDGRSEGRRSDNRSSSRGGEGRWSRDGGSSSEGRRSDSRSSGRGGEGRWSRDGESRSEGGRSDSRSDNRSGSKRLSDNRSGSGDKRKTSSGNSFKGKKSGGKKRTGASPFSKNRSSSSKRGGSGSPKRQSPR